MAMLQIRATRKLFAIRFLHITPVVRHLVGPPDPVSNLRPVIYDDAPPPPPSPHHPYSLKEFTGDIRDYQWKMQRQELDSYNQAFWSNVSKTAFSAAAHAHIHDRVIRVIMPPKMQCSRVCLRIAVKNSVNRHFRSFTEGGSPKRAKGRQLTAPSGGSVIGKASC